MTGPRFIPDAELPESVPLGAGTRRTTPPATPRCHGCAHWTRASESGTGPGEGWCGYWEKTTRRDASCDYFLDPTMVQDAQEADAEEHGEGPADTPDDPDDEADTAFPPDHGGPVPGDDPDPATADRLGAKGSPAPGTPPGAPRTQFK